MENKLTGSASCVVSANALRVVTAPPVVVGYFGKLRCKRSLQLLTHLAERLPDIVSIRLAGTVLPDVESAFNRLLQLPNTQYCGSYRYPDGVSEIYSGVHLNWGIDLSNKFNARLLLPNRIYEGGACGVPMIAEEGTATGDYIVAHDLGLAIAPPFDINLASLLSCISTAQLQVLRENVLAHPDSSFFSMEDDRRLLQNICA